MTLNLNQKARSLDFKERVYYVKKDKLKSLNKVLPETLQDNEDIQKLITQRYQLDQSDLNSLYDNSIMSSLLEEDSENSSNEECFEPHCVFPISQRLSADESISVLFISKIASSIISKKLNEVKSLDICSSLIKEDLFEDLFLKYLTKDISSITYRTLIFEFNLAIQNEFISCSKIEDIQSTYQELIQNSEYIDYLKDKYPFLVKKVVNRIHLFSNSFIKLIFRLNNDIELIEKHFECDELIVTNIIRGQGDSHHGADSVTIVEFDNNKKIVYKPRPVTSEFSFQKFLIWCNSRLDGLKLKTLKVVPRDGYGWVEYVQHESVVTQDKINNYYYRYGLLIAAMDCLNATDIHFENLIASGEHPVIIDLENIFQPIEIYRDNNEVPLYLMDLEFFTGSTFFTAMIDPIFIKGSLNGSPLTSPMLSESEKFEFSINDEGQFEVCALKEDFDNGHCLYYENKPVRSYDYSKEIMDGYKDFGQMVIKNKNELVSNIFPSFFKEIDVRVIFKPTRKYFRFLESLHAPYSLENSLNHDKYLHKLWIPAITKPALAKIVDSEAESCSLGDIPYFHTKVNSIDVYDHSNKKIENVLHMSGYDRTIEKLILFNNSTLKNNLACINYSLTHKRLEIGSNENDGDRSLNAGANFKKIYEFINRRIVFENEKLILVDLYLNTDMQTRHSELNNYIYSGLAGLCFSLAYYGKFENCEVSCANAHKISDQIFREFDFNNIDRLGACHGLGGIIYLASHLGYLWNEEYYFVMAEKLVDKAIKLAYTDRHFDIYSGLAGLILSMVSLYSVYKSKDLLKKIENVTNLLISMSETKSSKRWWLSSIPSNGPTTGFAHGLSGIGFSILKVYGLTNKEKYLSVSKEIHNYMMSCFDNESKSWLESQSSNSHGQLEVWCHGSPGISLFYSELLKNDNSIDVTRVYEASIDKTKDNNIFENDSLCHGSLGNIDVFLNSRNPQNKISIEKSEDVINETLQDIAGRDVRCGNKYKHHNLSLFTGFSGLAFQLMRVNNESYIPSVLTFEAPENGCK